MTGASVITEQMRQAVGVASDPYVFEIEKEPIRRWADAIGDPNPLFHDEIYARALGYRSLIAPPGFVTAYAYPVLHGKLRAALNSPLKDFYTPGMNSTFMSRSRRAILSR